jgi:hypothetical protein
MRLTPTVQPAEAVEGQDLDYFHLFLSNIPFL